MEEEPRMRFRIWKQELPESRHRQIQRLMLFFFQENAIVSLLKLQQKYHICLLVKWQCSLTLL